LKPFRGLSLLPVLCFTRVEQLQKYGGQLSSANVRDYLGSRTTTRNINRQIEKTAQEDPQNFWIFNNGITILTTGIHVKGKRLTLKGGAIINGAQTTGSLAEAAKAGKLGDAQILVRAIRCNDSSLVDSMIRYNNTQNPIKAWELRVIDPTQLRLRDEFGHLDVIYQLRRGGSRRRSSDVNYETLGPYLSAFYGDPLAAHKNKSDLFENEARYRSLFDTASNVRNLLFIYRLGEAVYKVKARLKEKVDRGSASEDEQAKYQHFRYGSFAFIVVNVCSEVIGLLLNARDMSYRKRVTLEDNFLLSQDRSEDLLSQLADAALGPIHMFLMDKDDYQVLKTQEGVRNLAQNARAFFEQVHKMKPDLYRHLTEPLKLL
jgi:hypothetical protein